MGIPMYVNRGIGNLGGGNHGIGRVNLGENHRDTYVDRGLGNSAVGITVSGE